MVLPKDDCPKIHDLLKEHKVLEHRQIQLADDELLVRILLDAEQSEAVLDALEQHNLGAETTRMVVLPVEATLPRANPEPVEAPGTPPAGEKSPERISREELFEDIKDAARCSRVYLAMTALSTIVAAIGLCYNNVAMIIGAMVIAPLLGPNVALALGTTLGDVKLFRRALLTALAGIAVALVLSAIIGALINVEPNLPELSARTQVGSGDVAVALASGCAGALAFTMGGSTSLIGVMVAVALLPPLVTAGLLFGGAQTALALGAFSLFLVNLICVNLSGVSTLFVQGIHPASWWEQDRAKKGSFIAIGLWLTLLLVVLGIILLSQFKPS